MRVSYMEIYNEELIDLLGAEVADNPRLRIYEDKKVMTESVLISVGCPAILVFLLFCSFLLGPSYFLTFLVLTPQNLPLI